VKDTNYEDMRAEARDWYYRPTFATITSWSDKDNDSNRYVFGLLGRTTRAHIFDHYKTEHREKGTPYLKRSTFYDCCPKEWIDPTFDKCVCKLCEDGRTALTDAKTLLQIGLPPSTRQYAKGFGAISVPKELTDEQKHDAELYQQLLLAIAEVEGHLSNDMIEEVRREKHPTTSRFKKEEKTSESNSSTIPQRSLTRKTVDNRAAKPTEQTKTKERGKTSQKEQTETLDLPEGCSSFTPLSDCVSCSKIEFLFSTLQYFGRKLQPISDDVWIKHLKIPRQPVEELITKWAYRVESWRDHLWVAGNQFRAFENDIQQLKEGHELWLQDFAMTVSLHQALKETQSVFFEKKYANNLGFITFRRTNGVIEIGRTEQPPVERQYFNFYSDDKVTTSKFELIESS